MVMPSKHIKEKTWQRIEELRIKGIIETKTDIKERDLLELILEKGIKRIDEIELELLAKKRK